LATGYVLAAWLGAVAFYSIVKNMLLHSRQGGGELRPADINALVDESLNLAYHGARAEKGEFNITLQRDSDTDAGTIVEGRPRGSPRVLHHLPARQSQATRVRGAGTLVAHNFVFSPRLPEIMGHVGPSTRTCEARGVPILFLFSFLDCQIYY